MTLIELLKQDFGQDVEWEKAITLITKPYVEALEFYAGLDWKLNTDVWQRPAKQALSAHREMFGGE